MATTSLRMSAMGRLWPLESSGLFPMPVGQRLSQMVRKRGCRGPAPVALVATGIYLGRGMTPPNVLNGWIVADKGGKQALSSCSQPPT